MAKDYRHRVHRPNVQGNEVAIPATIAVIADLWLKAESSLQSAINTKYHDLDEETITVLMSRELAFVFKDADDEVQHAFANDLRHALLAHHVSLDRTVEYERLKDATSGLLARVSTHNRRVEGRTGGDFGITISRPMLYAHWGEGIEIDFAEQGLLCQAKLKNRQKKWGLFTDQQLRTLPKSIDFLALCLYSYQDVSRRDLTNFQWQVCNGRELSEIARELKADKLTDIIGSSELIELLSSSEIGTGNIDEIGQLIHPGEEAKDSYSTPFIKLEITWSNWPPDLSKLFQKVRTTAVARQYQSM